MRNTYSPLAELKAELDRTRETLDQFANRTPSPKHVAFAYGLTRQADKVLWAAVRAQRFLGESWRVIGEEIGITKQAAHERFRGVDDELRLHGMAMSLVNDSPEE